MVEAQAMRSRSRCRSPRKQLCTYLVAYEGKAEDEERGMRNTSPTTRR